MPIPHDQLTAFVKARTGRVNVHKYLEAWPDLPRSKRDQVLKKNVRDSRL